MTVSGLLAGGVRLLRTQPGAVAVWGVLYLAMSIAAFALFQPMFSAIADFQRQVIAAQAAGAAPPALPAGFFGGVMLANLVLLAGLAVIFAAAVRAVAQGGRDRFGFMRVGMDEARLVGLGVLLVLIGIAAMIVVVLAMVIVAAIVVAVAGPNGAFMIFPLYLGMVALIVWAQTRISLAGVYTVLRGRIVIPEAWRATAGRFWTLFGAYLVIGLAFMVISLGTAWLINPDLVAMMTGTADPAVVEAAMARQFEDMFGARWLVSVAVTLVVNVALTALAFGVIATAGIALDSEAHDGVALS